ncbi:zinc metallopeptidase [Clostridium algidicarnis]|uniref:Zinc metallopeptidase n=1 Tax=Clostridium algidicarnis TaxID=37659 RepID=A0ABS6BZS2_9CLOT|nr:zinc metallopeptidase [Clostridium algidicarnis]MBB6631164.1 zinc metallopeptidase [Clostridium algidicarnis]MBB6696184.1 zinc metallopeptidase [Clostridium algidicarnis]MBU3193924.1 zinc metallopeptidase [Clostridium algidicarnis]MBU3195576.1 zinc metallopeptidase [Clostridium algidicarnis]MBU3203196.1 zinc metallopeptidase [Clostridium algidicarnis]
MFLFYDSTYLILVPALILSIWAQSKISSTFNKYSKIYSSKGYTGSEVARMILDSNGLVDVRIERVAGNLTDHYDPRDRVLRLSEKVYSSTSVASIGVAAHEVGHAIQHQQDYRPLIIRNNIVPVVNISSSASWIIFFIGIIMGLPLLTNIGIVLFSAVVLFQLITLPVEFNASNRAIKILEDKSILYENEIVGAKKVLSAAALTYVAATLTAISQLLRLMALSNRRND